MKLIIKSSEPRQLTQFRSAGGTWDTFSLENGKREVKEQLLKEQHSQCAYCTGSINFDTMKVEHWCSRNRCATNRDLDYTNLLAVCRGCFGSLHHCDTSKADQLIDLDPQNPGHINGLSYGNGTGELVSSNLSHQKEIDNILKLNIAPLKNRRKTMLASFKIGLKKKYKDKKANYQKELTQLQNRSTPYSMIVIKYLEKKISQRRS